MKTQLLTLIFLLTTAVSASAAPLPVTWAKLAPPGTSKQEKMYESFTDDEKFAAQWLYYKQTQGKEAASEGAEASLVKQWEADAKRLQAKGFDPIALQKETMISARKVNKKLDGKEVRIAGYVLPLEVPGGRVSKLLLVPYVGACIHVPPPPPNQIIFASIGKGIPVPQSIEEMFVPVYITGKLKIESASRSLFLTDGSDDIEMGYAMQVEKIEPFRGSPDDM